jgi:hypothetical protein
MQHGAAIAGAMAIATAVSALIFGALVAAGADPYGYVSQSLLWAGGNPTQFQTQLAAIARWPNADWSFAPLGYQPSAVRGLVVPFFPAGLPLQMAILAKPFGLAGTMLVVPILGGLTIWSAYRLGLRVIGDQTAALLSAVLVACSPIFLFQLMQPMTDVPVTAWWLASLVAALEPSMIGALGAGACASLAVLTRPNLVPLVVPVAVAVAFADSRKWPPRLARVALFGLALIPGVVLTAAVNAILFGSPLQSGYGSMANTFQLRNAAANLLRYPASLFTTHSPLLFLGFAAAARRRSRLFRPGVIGVAFVLTVFASYVFYRPFDHWSFLRYLLPAIPILVVLSVAIVDTIASAISTSTRLYALAFIAMVLPLYYVSVAIREDTFALKPTRESSFVIAAHEIAARTPDSAVVLSVLESGSLQLYGQRQTLRYDLLSPESVDQAIAFFDERQRPVYVALHSMEQADFVSRFPSAAQLLRRTHTATVDPLKLVTLYGPLRP